MEDVEYVICSGRGDVRFAYSEEDMIGYAHSMSELPLTSKQRDRGITEQPVYVYKKMEA